MMDIARSKNSEGKVNAKFQQLADDFGFKIKPCIAGRPNTKAKVESPTFFPLKREHNLDVALNSFIHYICNHKEFSSYFKRNNFWRISRKANCKDCSRGIPSNSQRDATTWPMATGSRK